VASFGVAMVIGTAAADEPAEFSAELRWRPESARTDVASGTESEGTQFLRTRLTANFAASANTSAMVQVQDSRTFGQVNEDGEPTSGTLTQSSDLGIHQAYLQFNEIFPEGPTFQAGRFELCYGNERILSASNWSNTGRAFDGARASLSRENWQIDAFTATLVERVGSSESDDVQLSGLYTTYKPANTDAFLIYDFDAQKAGEFRSLRRWTAGTYTCQEFGQIDVVGNGAFQFGSSAVENVSGDGVETDISAYLLNGELGCKFAENKARVAAGIDWASGDDPDSETFNAFNNEYYDGHAQRGMMDQFLGSNPEGLMDLYASCRVSPNANWTFMATGHNFTTAQDYASMIDATPTSSLGSEVDFSVSTTALSSATITAGGAAFFSNEDFGGPNPDTETWGFLEVTVNIK
jgi:hypothetical protein